MNVRTVCLSQLLNFRFLSLPHAASLLCLCVRTCAFCVCTCYQVNFVLGQAEERGMGDCTPNLAKAVPLYASRCCSKIEKRMQQVLKYYLTQLPLYYSFVCLLSPPPSPRPPPRPHPCHSRRTSQTSHRCPELPLGLSSTHSAGLGFPPAVEALTRAQAQLNLLNKSQAADHSSATGTASSPNTHVIGRGGEGGGGGSKGDQDDGDKREIEEMN